MEFSIWDVRIKLLSMKDLRIKNPRTTEVRVEDLRIEDVRIKDSRIHNSMIRGVPYISDIVATHIDCKLDTYNITIRLESHFNNGLITRACEYHT